MNLFRFLIIIVLIVINPSSSNNTPPPPQKALHIVFLGIPSYGHIKPTLDIVKALTQRGHRVTYFNVPKFKNEIEAAGGKFIDYNSPSASNAQPVNSKTMDLSLSYPALSEVMSELYPTVLAFIKNNNIDIIVYDQFAIWGKQLAKQFKIPSICSSIMFLRDREDWLKISTKIPEQKKSFSYLEMIDCISCYGADRVIAYTSAEFQPDFKDHKNIIFFGNRLKKSSKRLTCSHKSFNATSTIYISFGTLFNCDIDVMNTLIEFFSNTPYKIIISTGGNEEVYNKLLAEIKYLKNIEMYKFINQEEVLSEASVFITHAGAGSLVEGICHGVPMIMIPQMEEQQYNAYMAHKLGVGYALDSRMISKKDIQSALDDICSKYQKYRSIAINVGNTFLNAYNADSVAIALEKMVMEKRLP